MKIRRLLSPLAVWVVVLATTAPGQPPVAPPQPMTPMPTATANPPSAPPPTTATSVPVAVREAKPDVYFVKDKNGELVPLVGFTLEEFQRMLQEDTGLAVAPAKPAFRLDSVEAVGAVDDRNARLELTFTVEVDEAGWVRIPLGLRGSVLEQQAEYVGTGKFTLQYDATADEHILWIDGKSDTTHKLKLNTLTAVVPEGAAKSLHLYFPRAWKSSLKLHVPDKTPAVEVSPGAVLNRTVDDAEGSLIEASGVGGEFFLRWTKTDAAARRAPTLLEAQADVSATIDGHSVTYDAQIAVTSFGGEFDRFRIRLPPSAVLVADESMEVVLQKLPAAKNAKNESYEVRRVSGPAKSMIVRVQAVRPIEAAKGQVSFDLGGIEVLDAVRQWGYLGVRVVGDWQVLWGDRTQIRQVDASPEFFRGRSMAAVFEYFGRTFSLNARIAPRETRVTVEPSYTIDVTSRRVYLEAKLGYRVGGAKVFTLDADFLDWQIDEVGPPELIDVEAIVVGKGGPLSMPLLEPSTGDFELTVRAHRDLPEGATSLELWVPRPVAGVVGPASWTVRAADNVELAPRDASHAGLLRQTRGDARRFAGERAAWTYSTDAVDAKFTADYRVLSRTVRVRSKAEAELNAAGGVVQQLNYVVAREPIDALEFDVPARLAEDEKLQLRTGDDVLPWVVIDEGNEEARKPTRIRVNLPQARIGTFDLTASFPLPLERPALPASTAVTVPLLIPLDGELADNELRLTPDADVVVQHVDEAWSPTTTGEGSAKNRTTTYRAVAPCSEVAVGVRWEPSARARELYVDRTWIQSVWLGPTRWERAVFRFVTINPTVALRLPPQASSLVAFIDGKRAESADRTLRGGAVFDLAANGNGEHVIDVRYQVANGSPNEFPAPTLAEATAYGQTYRQIVYPSDTVLWRSSPGYASEYDWRRRGAFWIRTPRLEQADLERWCGAAAEPLIPDEANTYLFSAVGEPPALELKTIRRSTLVFAASAAVLAAALALLYLPILRRPGTLTAAAVVVGGLGFTYPETVPIALQAAAVGAVLALAAVLLERNYLRRQGRALRSSIEVASAAPRGSTKTRLVPPPVASGPSTTAPVDYPGQAPAAGGTA